MSSTYDTLIIGGGLTGLLLTHRLHHAGQSVALLEAREALGGSSRRPSTVEFFPATSENMELLEWARTNSPVPLSLDTREHRPQVYDEGKWRNFSGFGETNFQSVDELAALAFTSELNLDPGPDQLVRALAEQLPIAPLSRSEVTGLTIENGRVTGVVVNGEKTITANQVVFTAHPSLLNGLIEGEALPPKHRTRLAKMQGWTSVTLELNNTPPLCEDSHVRVFVHNAKEFEPVVGRVNGSRSLWMTLVPFDKGDEHEFIGQCIRHIKRQLKRAWPEGIDGQKDEKIYVQPQAFGQHALKTRDPLRLPELANLYLGNHALASQPGTLGSLEMARALERALASKVASPPEQAAEPTLET